MRDIEAIYTKRGTPLLFILSRLAFGAYFIFALWSRETEAFSHPRLNIFWLLYLVVLYLIAEYLYHMFLGRGIDLTFAWPLLFSIYVLNLTTILLGGQESLPLMNRAEHFAIFVLIGFVVWVFFTKYLPQDVWRDHPYYTALLVLSVTALAGVCNELVEVLFDLTLKTDFVGTHFDTSLDLLMNTLGTGLFLIVRLLVGYDYRKNPPG